MINIIATCSLQTMAGTKWCDGCHLSCLNQSRISAQESIHSSQIYIAMPLHALKSSWGGCLTKSVVERRSRQAWDQPCLLPCSTLCCPWSIAAGMVMSTAGHLSWDSALSSGIWKAFSWWAVSTLMKQWSHQILGSWGSCWGKVRVWDISQ